MPLEEIEKKLYRKNSEEQKVIPSDSAKTNAPGKTVKTGWSGEILKTENKQPGFLAKFGKMSRWLFWILIVGIVIIMTIGGFYFYQYFTARDIVSSLKAPSSIMIGVPFDIEVGLQNNYNHPINDIKLSMILPEGTVLVSESSEKRAFNKDFGNLDVNGNFQEKIPIIIFGNEQSLKNFEITISYVSPTLGSKARFEQTKTVGVMVQEPAIKLDIASPPKVLNGENFEIEVHYKNVSDKDFFGVELQLDYPGFFSFKSATVSPSVGNNIWRIGDLAKGKEGNFTVIGSVLGAEKSFFEIKGSLKIGLAGQKYLISEKTTNIIISPSPLSLNISLNDQPDSPVFSNSDLKYRITYRNNSDVGLNDAVIKAKLTGEMFNFQSLRTSGFFDSKSNTITWNVANTPELKVLSVAAENSVEFEIQTKENYPIKRVSDKNFILKIEGEISSPTIPNFVAADKTIGLANLETKVGGKIDVNNQVFFYEPDASFINKGVLPLKVNVPTDFTIHWLITNYSTDVRNVEVKAYLQSGIAWTGKFKNSVSSSTLTYNERTQEVSWLIDRIPATKGIISKPLEVIFQIEATPNVIQSNQPMPLLSQINIKAIDEFTNLELDNSAVPLATEAVSI